MTINVLLKLFDSNGRIMKKGYLNLARSERTSVDMLLKEIELKKAIALVDTVIIQHETARKC